MPDLRVAQRFVELIRRIQPRPLEVARARTRLQGIRTRLSASFPISRVVLTGSHTKGTAVRSFSDVDIFVVLRRDAVRWGSGYVSSATLLRQVRDDLQSRFPSTEIRRDEMSIVVEFSQGDHAVDVVPAIFRSPTQSGYPLFSIPDGSGGWLDTSPDLHFKYLRDADARSGGKLKRVIQLVKWWRVCRTPNVPLLSFHIEMALALSRAAVGAAPYSQVLALGFNVMNIRRGAALRDPCGVSGLIPAAKTEAQRNSVDGSLNHAAWHSSEAFAAEDRGDWREAVRQWDIVFNGYFPR